MKNAAVDFLRALTKSPLQVRLALCAVVALLWVWWPTLSDLANRWASESQYSHGFIVPVFAIFLLWSRRELLPHAPLKPTTWGLVLLAIGLGLRFCGTFTYFDWLSAVSLLPCLGGLCLLAGGWKALHWAWPAIAFLLFMVPLPHRLEVGLAYPLQRVATAVSTYVLQTLGFAAFAEGNVIRMGEIRIGVVEACSGLSMLVTFFALSTAVVLLSPRSPLEKFVIFLSAVPIALISNICRIVVTGIMHRTVGSEWANYVFHELAGWLMPLLALALLWVELRMLSWILVAPRDKESDYAALRHRGYDRRPAVPAKRRYAQESETIQGSNCASVASSVSYAESAEVILKELKCD